MAISTPVGPAGLLPPRCRRSHGFSALESLRALDAEVGRREARLAELNAKMITRPLAEKYPDLRPLTG